MKAALISFFSIVGGTVFGAEAKFEDLLRQFDYDRNAPLDVREEQKEERQGITVI